MHMYTYMYTNYNVKFFSLELTAKVCNKMNSLQLNESRHQIFLLTTVPPRPTIVLGT